MTSILTSGVVWDEIVENVKTYYICKNADEKPRGVRRNSLLWVWDIDTWFRTPDGYQWIKTQGDNSLFASEGIIIKSGQFYNVQSGLGVVNQSKLSFAATAYSGSGIISGIAAPQGDFRLLRSEVHISSSPAVIASGYCTLSVIAKEGIGYNTTLSQQDLSAGVVTDYVVAYGQGFEFKSGNIIFANWNNGSGQPYGLKITHEML